MFKSITLDKFVHLTRVWTCTVIYITQNTIATMPRSMYTALTSGPGAKLPVKKVESANNHTKIVET
jgi:hypothetical protein